MTTILVKWKKKKIVNVCSCRVQNSLRRNVIGTGHFDDNGSHFPTSFSRLEPFIIGKWKSVVVKEHYSTRQSPTWIWTIESHLLTHDKGSMWLNVYTFNLFRWSIVRKSGFDVSSLRKWDNQYTNETTLVNYDYTRKQT